MALNLKMIMSFVDRATAPARRTISKVARSAKEVSQGLRTAGTAAIAGLTAPLAAIGGFSLRAFGQMEQMTIAFESMLGSADKARNLVKDLMTFSASTPFQLQGIGQAARQLLAFGVAQKNLVPTLQVLGDIAAGANIPLEEMAAIFGKTKAKGKAMTEELLQLSDRGVPIIDVLADKLGRPKEEIFELASQGRITFDFLQKALQSMTHEGGIFANQMEKQSKSLFGLWSTLQDNFFNTQVVIGSALQDAFQVKEGIREFTKWIQETTLAFIEFAKANPGLVKIGASVLGIVLVVGPLLLGLGLVVGAFAAIGAAGAAVIAAFIAVGVGLTALVVLINKYWSDIVRFVVGSAAKILGTFNDLVDWISAIDLTAIGTRWVLSIISGLAQAWDRLVDWFDGKIADLQSKFTFQGIVGAAGSFLTDTLGIGDDNAPSSGSAVPSQIGPQSGAKVDGGVTIEFQNVPPGTRIRRDTTRSDIPIDIDAGYALGGA